MLVPYAVVICIALIPSSCVGRVQVFWLWLVVVPVCVHTLSGLLLPWLLSPTVIRVVVSPPIPIILPVTVAVTPPQTTLPSVVTLAMTGPCTYVMAFFPGVMVPVPPPLPPPVPPLPSTPLFPNAVVTSISWSPVLFVFAMVHVACVLEVTVMLLHAVPPTVIVMPVAPSPVPPAPPCVPPSVPSLW